MSDVRRLVDCFFRYKRRYEETRELIYLVYMENVAREIGGEFYSWSRRIAPDYAEWWDGCDVEVSNCMDLVRMAVACWPSVRKRALWKCGTKELMLLVSGEHVC